MKHILWAILGVCIAWGAISYFTGDWDMWGLTCLITGIGIGYGIRKYSAEKQS
ncbi:hypothetical protein [Jeotgalibacillus campisalis]|uniref:Uncharacterized protein n=1 Tax=Jeotgalibacillus campisalis TaxID=220754 RepID=A0A0C2S304_9BACL|nr:hypothetical protein [Jeotgalibacillus campisalis]KIL48384.1 hypothetical protein KR50_14200 [Jeotgalibacillus campisalis]